MAEATDDETDALIRELIPDQAGAHRSNQQPPSDQNQSLGAFYVRQVKTRTVQVPPPEPRRPAGQPVPSRAQESPKWASGWPLALVAVATVVLVVGATSAVMLMWP